jgi:polyhydroxyalkanoate synthesis repressor PhaR
MSIVRRLRAQSLSPPRGGIKPFRPRVLTVPSWNRDLGVALPGPEVPEVSMSTEPRVIKRYANRKLYDTSRSCYITLEEIAELLRTGEEIRIVDNKSKEDLTSVTLAQILVEEEKRQPRGTRSLRGLIEQSGELLQKKADRAGTHAARQRRGLGHPPPAAGRGARRRDAPPDSDLGRSEDRRPSKRPRRGSTSA